MLDFNRVLVPVDFSGESGLAVDWAVRLLKNKGGGTIFLLHVFHRVTNRICAITGGCVSSWEDGAERVRWDNEKNELERWQQRIPDPVVSDFIVDSGSLTDAINRACQKYAIDLVVLTKRATCGLSRLLHPHACVRIVRISPCPVLILHLNRKTRELAAVS